MARETVEIEMLSCRAMSLIVAGLLHGTYLHNDDHHFSIYAKNLKLNQIIIGNTGSVTGIVIGSKILELYYIIKIHLIFQ